MVARTVTEATEWLEQNDGLDRFLLWVDMWDPHEPFDPPSYDWDRYRDPTYSGDKIIYPAYGRPNYMTADEHQSVRALYAGKITLVDRWVGRLLEKIDMLGLT
jgi:arylsulfatase A-like enzyme